MKRALWVVLLLSACKPASKFVSDFFPVTLAPGEPSFLVSLGTEYIALER